MVVIEKFSLQPLIITLRVPSLVQLVFLPPNPRVIYTQSFTFYIDCLGITNELKL
jgi:hypothetical protein